MNPLFYTWYESPFGRLLLVGSHHGLNYLSFASGKRAISVSPQWIEDRAVLWNAIAQLEEYFRGRRRTFDLALFPEGTPFQKQVWTALETIPYGETISYQDLARRIGRPKTIRAVGAANGANPIPIIIPCHRVIGHNGSLTGFGGGLPVKRRLLELESRQLALL